MTTLLSQDELDSQPNQNDAEMANSNDLLDKEFLFQQSLAVHQGSVRCLTVLPGTDSLVSGSIDKSCKLFEMDKNSGKYSFDKEFVYHEGFVYGLHPCVSQNGFYSSSKDTKIMHVDSSGNPARVFEGHTSAVNSLHQSIPEEIVSGSWDGTARIWDTATGACKHVLEGHTHAVAVLSLPNGIVITGSQDKSLRLWFQGKQEKEIANAHEDIIRFLQEVPGIGFASCSNDETVKLWTTDGQLLQTFKGHQGFVFALKTLSSGEIVSGGDDCTVKIWSADGKCKQTISLPRTVWAITQNSCGDLIIGTEDYKIRTFTRDANRIADATELAEFEEELKSKTTSTEMSQFDKAPDVSEQATIVGQSEGEIKVFKKQGVPSAFMWKSAEFKWEYVGEVVDPSGGGGGGSTVGVAPKVYAGDEMFAAGEYDYIFDVELGDGVMRKLPYNAGGNSLEAAEKFCVRENLSRSNVQQIITFIMANSQQQAPQRSQQERQAAAVQKEEKDNTMKKELLYEAVKIDGPKKKILEFNEADNFLAGKELMHFEQLCEVLKDKANYWQTRCELHHLNLLDKLLGLPIDKVFPVLDLYRIFLLHPDMSQHFKKFETGMIHINTVMGHLGNKAATDPVKMLSLRCIVNLFRDQAAIFVLRERREKVVEGLAAHLENPKATVREACVTALLNYSICFLTKDDPEGRIQILSAFGVLAGKDIDEQSQKRMQAAVNNLCYKNSDAKDLAQALNLKIE